MKRKIIAGGVGLGAAATYVAHQKLKRLKTPRKKTRNDVIVIDDDDVTDDVIILDDDEVSEYKKPYIEKQVCNHCGVHALNHIFQERIVTYQQMTKLCLDVMSENDLGQNFICDATGNFGIDLIELKLNQLNFFTRRYWRIDEKDVPHLKRDLKTSSCLGMIILFKNHYTAISTRFSGCKNLAYINSIGQKFTCHDIDEIIKFLIQKKKLATIISVFQTKNSIKCNACI